jgi:hypothetical protein
LDIVSTRPDSDRQNSDPAERPSNDLFPFQADPDQILNPESGRNRLFNDLAETAPSTSLDHPLVKVEVIYRFSKLKFI